MRLGAFAQLERLGKAAAARLIQELSEGDEQGRISSAIALGRIGDSAAKEPLRTSLNDGSAAVRREAALALAAMADTSVASRLEALLASEKGVDRLRVAAGLGKLGNRHGSQVLVSPLKDQNPEVRAQSAAVLQYAGDGPALGDLLALRERDPVPAVRAAALESAIALRGGRADDLLRGALKDADGRVRLHAAKQLLAQGDRSGVPELKAALASAEPQSRASAAEGAADFLEPDEIYLLARALRDDHPQVQMNAIKAATRMKEAGVLPEIRAAFRKGSSDVVAVAAQALADLGGDRTSAILEGELSSERAPCRIAAATELLRLSNAPAKP